MSSARPEINVTPLIDVLLVLLIIFMVISPLKPTDFKTKIPQEVKTDDEPNPLTLVVSLNTDAKIGLNRETDLGTIDDPEKLIRRLSEIFQARTENHVYAESLELKTDLTEDKKIHKTVFIKAPRKIDYGKVVKLIDAVKIAGASPISLQIDDLN